MPQLPNLSESPAGPDIASKAMLLRVRFGLLGNSRKVSNSAVSVDADKDLIRVSKTLLDSKELSAIRKLDGELRKYIYNTCLPGFDEGLYFLPFGLIETMENKIKRFQAERVQLVDIFLLAYDDLCRDAEERLRGVYRAADYPSVDEVRAKFTFSWHYWKFGVPGELEGMSKEIFDRERDKQAALMRDAAEEIKAVMRGTMAELVDHLRERLTTDKDGKQKVFRDTAVTNIQDFLDTFDLRNVTDDAELSGLVQRARILVTGQNPQALRDFDGLRANIREGMTEIAAKLETLVADKPTRKFRPEIEM